MTISADVDSEALFPYLYKDMPDYIRTNLIYRLQDDTESILNDFIILGVRLKTTLTRSEITAKEIIHIIVKKNYKYRKIFEDCDTIDKLLDEAEKLWSFFDYGLIELFILCFFEDEKHSLRVLLNDYVAKFERYARRRICECPSNVFKGEEKNNGKVFVFKIEDCTLETMTLSKLKRLCFRLNSTISSCNLRLLETNSGCVQLTFRALPNADDMIQELTREEQQALRNMGVLSITYGKQTLNLVSLLEKMTEHEDYQEITKNSTSGILIAK